MRAILGGTFEVLHEGHKKLLDRAKEYDVLIIGITSDEFANKRKGYSVSSFEERKQKVLDYIGSDKKVEVFSLGDEYGIAPNVKADAIVVSEETRSIAEKINEMRKEHGLPELEIVSVPMVQAEDGGKLSVERIKKGQISMEGKPI